MACGKATSSKRCKGKGKGMKAEKLAPFPHRNPALLRVVTEGDLESDEATMALYKRWCVIHKIHRTPEEMQERFKNFKKSAIRCFKLSHSGSHPCNCFPFRWSDLPREEELRMRRRSMGLIFPIKARYKNQHGYKKVK